MSGEFHRPRQGLQHIRMGLLVERPEEPLAPVWTWNGYHEGLVSNIRKWPGPSGGEWALSLGAWGDAFASVGTARHLGLSPFWLHVGYDEHLAAFLGRQDGIQVAHLLRPPDWQVYERWHQGACMQPPRQDGAPWWPEMCGLAGITPTKLHHCQVNPHLASIKEPHWWHEPRLDPAAVAWAEQTLRTTTRPLILHPYSPSSNAPGSHWAYWPAYLAWLAAEYDGTLVLTGAQWPVEWGERPRHPRILDLIGRTETMEQVLALALLCRGTVGTSNSLSMWSVITERPGLYAANRHIGDNPGYLFYRWAATSPNTIVNWKAPLGEMQEKTWEWLRSL